MADVKIGLNQTSRPAPIGYRKFENAYLLVLLPAITSFLAVIPVSTLGIKIEAAGLILSAAVVKGLGMVLGNGQSYAPTNETVENQSAAK